MSNIADWGKMRGLQWTWGNCVEGYFELENDGFLFMLECYESTACDGICGNN